MSLRREIVLTTQNMHEKSASETNLDHFGKTCNANGGLALCTLRDFSSAVNLQKYDTYAYIDDFQDLDGADDKINYMVIFYLSNLRRKLET